MAYLLVGAVALLVAALTLFSGFGLGTLLLPAFAVFFSIETAVAATAIVHLANNVFKLVLIGKDTHWGVLVRFAIPAVVLAFIGARLLGTMAGLPSVGDYELAGKTFTVTTTGLVVGLLVALFALLDLLPAKKRIELDPKWLPLGGALSGFFGGVSGHQGALRSAFLIRAGLTRDEFVATAATSSMLVDLARLLVYGLSVGVLANGAERSPWPLVATACLCAFVGSFLGARLVKKTTIEGLHRLVGAALLIAGGAMAAGLI